MWLSQLNYQRPEPCLPVFPWTLPLLESDFTQRLESSVTFLAGENGSGKSSLLEAIAVACAMPTIGTEDTDNDDSLEAAREMAKALRLGWRRKTRSGFFLRAEDFFGFQKRINTLRSDLARQLAAYESERTDKYDEGLERAIGSVRGQMSQMEHRYGIDADAFSHGEAFFNLCQKRITAPGLYLLDEPETPLSPLRQLALMQLIKDAVNEGSQFIIASHSPLLLAFPEAQIWYFESGPPRVVDWDELDSVRLWRAFFGSPESFIRRLA